MKTNSYGLKEVADVYYFPLEKGSDSKTNTILDSEGKVRQITVTVSDKKLNVKVGDNFLIKDDVAVASASAGDTTVIPYKYGFDSLKVSNIEVTSEETTANGGKGNPELISWSYGKAATLTIEDALMNLDTCHLIFGTAEGKKGDTATTEVTIDANSFPDSYFIVGTTVIRSFVTGNDEPFVFVIPKAKANTEGTFTMEAEGDPSTFEMTLKCLAQEINLASGTEKDVLIKFYKPVGE